MVILKFLGLVLILAALAALGYDGFNSFEAGQIQIHSLAEIWTLLLPSLYESFTSWSTASFPVGLIPIRDAILGFPAWADLGVLGIVIAGLVRLADR